LSTLPVTVTALARDADHVRVGDAREAVQDLLDLARADALAAADDHVLDAADDAHAAVVVHHREVAGVHPAVLVDGGAGGHPVAPTTEHRAVAARAPLARRPAVVVAERLERDRRVLGHIAEGASNRAIAAACTSPSERSSAT
jgi:hypothetical protein